MWHKRAPTLQDATLNHTPVQNENLNTSPVRPQQRVISLSVLCLLLFELCLFFGQVFWSPFFRAAFLEAVLLALLDYTSIQQWGSPSKPCRAVLPPS